MVVILVMFLSKQHKITSTKQLLDKSCKIQGFKNGLADFGANRYTVNLMGLSGQF